MDLTKSFPRSPKASIAGITMAARAADKGRASAAGTLGDYNYDCPMDRMLFRFLGTDGTEYLAAVSSSSDDSGVAKLIEVKLASKSHKEIDDYNQHLLGHAPKAGTDGVGYYTSIRGKVGHGRTDIFTWPDLIDVEEGRDVPHRSDTPDWAKPAH
ncbi:MAG: DUF5069 domain-containing protein [Chloroflexi bacterium]|nr:DUF5069 domain-containing protein [Chloroflexota bacterium]